ncbi:glycosyltransferase [Prochlorococcus sp. MIT 1306]|uniref:glycosyltransferase n=1 Tax=Prochlorococcus sp. MIT 1306 TaxID=1799667 RepID=UPI0007B36454|nr:glycosyltransferase [Prochlorococcus sp. MIT 1306]KZR61043.1 Hyaluronan synthase [Prochlorococcus sp. MIT 1306]
MINLTFSAKLWPPFSIDDLPEQVRGVVADWQRAPIRPHDLAGDYPSGYLVSVVVPCFNPDPQQFAQLLLSLQQQSDQRFDLLLINDGSTADSWRHIERLIEDYPWIRVLHQPANQGISSALNLAVKQLQTPYIAILDQDDLLHPAALAFVNRHLTENKECRLLYTDHIAFQDDRTRCQYIPKFPWNPAVLLEFNYLIHLTVIRTEAYQACGGMNSEYDGIQDWDFYLRLSKVLRPEQVGYLPLPLYAWRLSDQSVASSATPKLQLLEKAQEFLGHAHEQLGESTRVALEEKTTSYYKFGIDRSDDCVAKRRCNILLLGNLKIESRLQRTLQSIQGSEILFDQIFSIRLSDHSSPASAAVRIDCLSTNEVGLGELHDLIPDDQPLLVLQVGASLQEQINPDLIAWLERTSRWQEITFPCFTLEEPELCISAGYAMLPSVPDVYIPLGQHLSKNNYNNDFATYSHVRPVDLPSPAVQLLCSSVVRQTLAAFASRWDPKIEVTARWWACLLELNWDCCCISDVFVGLDADLAKAEHQQLAVHRNQGLCAIQSPHWLGATETSHNAKYSYWLERTFFHSTARVHPLVVQYFLSLEIHANQLKALSRDSSTLSLLPDLLRKPLVILTPTELNARSNGHACILTLALHLQEMGHTVHLLPFKPLTFFRDYFSELPEKFQVLSFISDPQELLGAVLLVPESAPKALIKRLRPYFHKLIWWLLAPAGVLTEFRPNIRLGDFLVGFSEFALPGQTEYLFVQPELDSENDPLFSSYLIKYRHQPAKKKQILLYTGKGRLKALPRSLHRYLLGYKVILITRSWPSKKSELTKLLIDSKGLISCDPMTNLNLEAAILGLPVYLTGNPFPARCFRNFPVDLTSLITDSPGAFIARLSSNSPLKQIPLSALILKSRSSVDIFDLLLSDPPPLSAMAYRVSQITLDQIEQYRSVLMSSRTIQALKDGQSFSSAFLGEYVDSFKYPFWAHAMLCNGLIRLDDFADLLASIKLLRPSLLLWKKLGFAFVFRFLVNRLISFNRITGINVLANKPKV